MDENVAIGDELEGLGILVFFAVFDLLLGAAVLVVIVLTGDKGHDGVVHGGAGIGGLCQKWVIVIDLKSGGTFH